MNKVCIDASIAVAWLSYDKYTENANNLRREWLEKDDELLGPPAFYSEVMSFLRQQVLFKRMLPEEVEEAFSICLDIPIRIVSGRELYRTAWRMAKELKLPVYYEAQYLAVAELEDCEFWTTDKKLFTSIKDLNRRIRWIGDYGQVRRLTEDIIETASPPKTDSPGLWRRM